MAICYSWNLYRRPSILVQMFSFSGCYLTPSLTLQTRCLCFHFSSSTTGQFHYRLFAFLFLLPGFGADCQQRPVQVDVPAGRTARVHSGYFPLCRTRNRRPRFLPRRLRWTTAGKVLIGIFSGRVVSRWGY